MIIMYLIYICAGLGTGIVPGLAGLSAAVVITPMLVSLCGWASYDAVTVALASDVLASMLSQRIPTTKIRILTSNAAVW